MIHLTRINRVPLVLNEDLIEHVETTPDTVISLTNGQKFMVLESADEIIRSVVAFRRQIAAPRLFPIHGSEFESEKGAMGNSDPAGPDCAAPILRDFHRS